jgi:hypothetical protein
MKHNGSRRVEYVKETDCENNIMARYNEQKSKKKNLYEFDIM